MGTQKQAGKFPKTSGTKTTLNSAPKKRKLIGGANPTRKVYTRKSGRSM